MNEGERPTNLGEMLLADGLISSADLNRALTEQLVLGMRLGSCVVALKLCEIDDVNRSLGQLLGLPPARTPDFAEAKGRLLQSVAPQLCERYWLFPLREEERTLHVAMIDPGRLDLLDEVRFSLGRPVQPHAAVELQIYYHLERCYGIVTPRPVPQSGGAFGLSDLQLGGPIAEQVPPSGLAAFYTDSPAADLGPTPEAAAGPGPAPDPEPVVDPEPDPTVPLDQRDTPDPLEATYLVGEVQGPLPAVVQRMIPLLRSGARLRAACDAIGVAPAKGQAIVGKLVAKGLLSRR